MHYPRKAFSKNGEDTITPTDPNAQIGQRNGLSAGDIAAVRAMYPGCGIVKPPWQESGQLKTLIDTRFRFKKVRDDLVIKPLRDPKLPRDPGPVKTSLDPMPFGRPQVLTGGGTLQPFSLATPHHAPVAAAYAASGPSRPTGLEQELLELEAAMAQAQATAAQATAEAARLRELYEAIADAYTEGGGLSGTR